MNDKIFKNEMGYYFEQFIEGSLIKHSKSKTILESDNNLFCLLTMNHHPLHIDTNFAIQSEHKKTLVVGTLVFSLVVGLTVSDLSGKAIANLNYSNIEHINPVFLGDTINAESKILNKRNSRTKSDRGIMEVETFGINQKGQKVIRFNREILIMKRETND